MYQKYASEAMEFIQKIEADGCRFPGSAEEKAAAEKIQIEIKKRTNLTPKTEEFVFAPRASIGAINYLGWATLALLVFYYISATAAILALVGYVGILVFTLTQIIRYTGMWDFCFKKEKAKNIITELGEGNTTVFLGAHYDSSWCWKLSVQNPKTALIKAGYGVLCALAMIGFSIMNIKINFAGGTYGGFVATYVVPIFFIPGFFFITQFLSHDKTIGSPGAMDNLSGIGVNMMVMKYFKDHPEELPKDIKLVNICFAAEEAGLKGSSAYAKAHKSEPALKNAYQINVDSIADAGHFEVVKGDLWQGTKFDQRLIDMSLEAMRETGKVANPKTIVNPIGGCDSTPFCKIGIPTVTIAAQNPTPTNYYHTCLDKSERFEASTLETGIEIIVRLVKKIGAIGSVPHTFNVDAPEQKTAEAPTAEAPADAVMESVSEILSADAENPEE